MFFLHKKKTIFISAFSDLFSVQNLSLFVAHYSFMTTLLSMNMYERKQNQKLD